MLEEGWWYSCVSRDFDACIFVSRTWRKSRLEVVRENNQNEEGHIKVGVFC